GDDEPPAVPARAELADRANRDLEPAQAPVRPRRRGRVRRLRGGAEHDPAGARSRLNYPSSRVDFDLTQDQKEIQALTRDFAKAEIEPHAAQWDRDHHFPRDLFAKLAELGLMGACVPEEYGGGGGGFLSSILVLAELSPAPPRGPVTRAGLTP